MNDDTYDLLARAIEHARSVVRASECSEAFSLAAAECLRECERCLPSLDEERARRARRLATVEVWDATESAREDAASDALYCVAASLVRLAEASTEIRRAEGDLRRLLSTEATK